MLKRNDPAENEPVPPECRATVELLQRVLDGDATADALDADAHRAACPTCRERAGAARLLLSALAVRNEPAAVPSGLTAGVLDAIKADRRSRARYRLFAAMGGFAVAAAVLVGVWFIAGGQRKPDDSQPKEVVQQPDPPEVAPPPRVKPATAPQPRPVRIGDAFASAGQSLMEAPKPLADSVAVTPKLLGALTEPFTAPPGPMADLEPARKTLAELPDAAMSGLEPVTDTAQKAFGRFLRDVGSVQPKPNS